MKNSHLVGSIRCLSLLLSELDLLSSVALPTALLLFQANGSDPLESGRPFEG